MPFMLLGSEGDEPVGTAIAAAGVLEVAVLVLVLEVVVVFAAKVFWLVVDV